MEDDPPSKKSILWLGLRHEFILYLGSTDRLVTITLIFTFLLIITAMLLILIITIISLSWENHLSNNNLVIIPISPVGYGGVGHIGKSKGDLFMVRVFVDAIFCVNNSHMG